MVLGSAWLQSLPDQFLEVSRNKGRASLHWTVESVERVPAGRNVEQRDLESMQGIRMVVKKDWEVRQDRVDGKVRSIQSGWSWWRWKADRMVFSRLQVRGKAVVCAG